MLVNIIRGLLIGISNIIPGVSGGTFALIMGIYDRLIDAVSNIEDMIRKNFASPAGLVSGAVSEDSVFLSQIVLGALISIGVFSWIIDYLINSYPGATLSFFLGLILPSLAVPYRMTKNRSLSRWVFAFPGFALVAFIGKLGAGISSAGSYGSPVMLFISGAVAISAMILPGISGSFILLLMGMYQPVIRNIKAVTSSLDPGALIYLCIFGAGCLFGIVFFVKLMKILLKKFRDMTLFFLMGLVLGSIVFLWPFKTYRYDESKEEISITASKNRLPVNTKEGLIYGVFLIAGVLGSAGIGSLAKEDNKY